MATVRDRGHCIAVIDQAHGAALSSAFPKGKNRGDFDVNSMGSDPLPWDFKGFYEILVGLLWDLNGMCMGFHGIYEDSMGF